MTYQVNRLAVSRQASQRKRVKQLPIFNTLNFQSQLNSNTSFNNTLTSQVSLDEINTTIYIQTGGVI